MRSNELRIGNLVGFYKSEEKEMQVGRIDLIELDWDDNEYKVRVPEYSRILLTLEGIKPIPLTEEWLVKFGFERNKKTFVDGAYAVTFSRNKDGGWAIYDTSIDEGTNYLTPNLGFCQHVHQLQNLYFALTGKELTIKE